MFCVPIIASNTEEAIKKMGSAAGAADVLEVRLDLMDSFDIPAIVGAAQRSVLITYRSAREGGKGKDGPDKAAGYIISAIKAGADLVDVELGLPPEARRAITEARGRSEIIVSTHITGGTPPLDELERIFRESVDAGGDIIKIVTRAKDWDDNIRVLELVRLARKEGVRVISFCMGTMGRLSRIFSLPMGAFMTFASLGSGQESADGQIPVDKMKEMVGFFSI